MRRVAGKVLLVLGAVACFAAGGLADHLARGRADAAEPVNGAGGLGLGPSGRPGSSHDDTDFGTTASLGDEGGSAEDSFGPRPGETAAQLFDRAVAAATPGERRELLYSIGARLDPATAREALGWVDRLPSSSDRQIFLEDVLNRIAEQDPQGAIALAGETLRGQRRSDVIATMVQNWNSREPDQALSWALAQPAGTARDRMLSSLVGSVASTNPERALEIVSSLQPGAAANAMYDVFSTWARNDPAAAAAHLSDITTSSARRNVAYDVASSWADQSPEAALAWARTLPSERDRRSALEGAIRSTMMRDPAAGFELALRTEEISDQGIGDFAASAALEDTASALSLVQSMPAGERRDAALSSVISIVAETEPERAARLAEGLAPGERRTYLFGDVARTLAMEDPAAAASWAAGLSDEEAANGAMNVAIGTWADNDPRAAAAFVDSLPAGDLRDSVEATLVEDWADTDPRRAARWAMTHGGNQEQLLGRLIERWSFDEADEAAAWVRSLPPGETRDDALAGLGTTLSLHGDSAAALDNIERIGDEESRDEQRRILFTQWNDVDPEGAQAYLEGTDLPDEVRSELLDPEPTGGCVCPEEAGDVDGAADEEGEVEAEVEAEEPEEV
jgi:hypothetical protein